MRRQNKALWEAYEKQVAAALQAEGGVGVDVSFDELGKQKLPGRFSGTDRQIDIIVRGLPGAELIVVDCKCLRRRIHVRDVEAFAGLLQDVAVEYGLLISTRRSSQAAKRRAASIEGCKLKVRGIDDWEFLSRTRVTAIAHTLGSGTASVVYFVGSNKDVKTIEAEVGKQLFDLTDPVQANRMFSDLQPGVSVLPPPPPLLDVFRME